MERLADYIVYNLPFLQQIPRVIVDLIIMLFFATCMLLFWVALFAGITSWVERRVAGRIQSRIGPNRVGPQGFLQWIADGLKCFLKEDFVPAAADKKLFLLAPYIVFAGMFAVFVVVPFGDGLIISNLNIGIFYVLAISSLVVVGILMSGWSSNNKWSLLGGMRSAAQIVSYEIPVSLAILPVILLTGSLGMQDIIRAQGPYPWQWFAFHNPFTFIAFFIFFIGALAEGNRTPFDIPEAESELVAGYNTEYSGMRFVFFFFAEWANLYIIAALTVTLFLGGWNTPAHLYTNLFGLLHRSVDVAGTFVFILKSLFLVFVIIWIRWTLPRLRVDQMMDVCWKYFVPFSFANIVGTIIWMVLADAAPVLGYVRYILFVVGLMVPLAIAMKITRNFRLAKSEIHLNPFI
ncbi:MAG: NADH-quinone oxidoreductase subunit NuoH [Candidatus Latescibacteria bacterium]|nr:NADH-quinone oxidoreductase subunit NuoH [Candidatus Latescibacterota bacterium]NIM66393.1 NADH-quinone oxidoreductase subunit NuoH [Candidatus Latescibacterota bacterium]NIO02872.1 NADH-quinone oxidoreductase subunit NuoH [Candidatus Latescibacterota bacterium]NIO30007.1 NADH-quinone oxidoreductase subunit NuoH [Candidatus Latescibacterota bacterium]NIO57622.1 NADH-quinone oxidoreductase subunit NuoH [Candidatus Latescibacterota bacterium]